MEAPDDVANALAEQAGEIRKEIERLTASLKAIEQLKTEVLQMQTVNFKKYADIIVNLQMKNDSYHLIKHFDDGMLDNIRSRFDKAGALNFMQRFNQLGDAIVQLKEAGVPPESEKGQRAAEEYWGLVMEFTNGDVSMLPELNQNRKNGRGGKRVGTKAKACERVYRTGPAGLFFNMRGRPIWKGREGERMNTAIQVCGLQKSYGGHAVLKGLDFQIFQGEIFSLLGVNGAGKTTALECMEGLRSYDGGTIVTKGKTGIQLQSASLPAHIKPLEAVTLFSKWKKTKAESSMLAALGIQELEKKQYFSAVHGAKTAASPCPCACWKPGHYFSGRANSRA